MTAVTSKPPAVPPRPSRSPDKASTAAPMVPPRPNRQLQRSVSPNPDRFAPSPLISETAFVKSSKPPQPGARAGHGGDPVTRSTSVELPSLGEEGMEYAGLAEELSASKEGSASPEQTRTVAQDLKLHEPKPSLPAASAKQRVMAVTRTDSERAASFGIGKPSSVEDATPPLPDDRSLKKKTSTASQLSAKDTPFEDEHGIPEIGQQVPMYKNAGDVQAPSPALATAESPKARHHARKTSGRGSLPPGSYGLHGHGVPPQDKLEKAYFEKHPDLLKKEHVPHHYDRPNDFSLSRDDLNKIVRETASRGTGLGVKDYAGTPSDQVGWQALDESASRITSPGLASTEPSPIRVEEPGRRRSAMSGDAEAAKADEEAERPYAAPILADDEVAKDPMALAHQPAVEPPVSELEESSSRPTSRPGSIHKENSFELRPTPLEDVQEYEPLFKDDEKQDEKPGAELPAQQEAKHKSAPRHRFPSADVWEDAPSSVHYTAEVSTPQLFDEQDKPSPTAAAPARDGETPAQAFARHQEELAEKEAHGQRSAQKPLWAQHQKHLMAEKDASRPGMQRRFPSRDVWEDAPESLQLETTVSTPQQDDEGPSPPPADSKPNKPGIPARPQPKSPEDKPPIPERPKPRQLSADDKPAVPERPKPQIPPRPAKAGPTSGGAEPPDAAAPPPRQKPAVPARPMGSKIAALQAGFMSDLNRRLQLGPQAPAKREEPAAAGDEPAAAAQKEKVPLSDARKGRARGPQRRAPASRAAAIPSAAAPAAAAITAAPSSEAKPAVVCAVVSAVRFFEIDPEDGAVSVGRGWLPSEGDGGKEQKGEETREVPAAAAAASGSPAAAAGDAAPAQEKPAAEADRTDDAAPEPNMKSGPQPEPVSESEPERKTESESEPKAESDERAAQPLATNMAGEALIEEQTKPEQPASESAAAPGDAAASGPKPTSEPEVASDVEMEAASAMEAEPRPEAASAAEPELDSDTAKKPDSHEPKALATNLAGETLIEEEVKKDAEERVEDVKVVEN